MDKFACKSTVVRRKRKYKCPNPLFETWLTEWKDEATSKGLYSRYNFARVIIMEKENTENATAKLEPLFCDLNVDDTDSQVTEITSLCLKCGEDGITKLLLTKIPFYKDVVIMSFECLHCNWRNNELQPASTIQEKGIIYKLRVTNPKDLNREVVKTEWASIVIPELEFEIPSKSQEGGITSIEGVLQRAIDGVEMKIQDLLKTSQSAVSFQSFVEKLRNLKNVDKAFNFVLRDITGNSFLENIYVPKPDPEMQVSYFERSRDENIMLGIINTEEANGQELEGKNLKDEVLEFPTCCHYCNSPCVTNMKVVDIPHFKSVVIMATVCDTCGHKTNEVKNTSGIEPQGIKIMLKIEDENDLKRDFLKSDTCSIKIPELELDIGPSAICGRYTTVEGLLENIRDLVQNNPFATGDSANYIVKERMEEFKEKIKQIFALKLKVTLILDDPCGLSFMQSIGSPNSDLRLTLEKYERTHEQNEELGLNDMKVENYEGL